MMNFDKLMLVSSTKLIKRFKEDEFEIIIKEGEYKYYKYKKPLPYGLTFITINFLKNELIIEFTSKISKLSFFELINEDTIRECLYSIEPLVEFETNGGYIDDILDEFRVFKCHVTKDVPYHDVWKLKQYVKSNLANNEKWACEKWDNGFVLINLLSTPRHKKRITIYDKGKEIDRKAKKYKPFLETIYEDGFVYNDFEGIVRIEANINSVFQIKKLLDIPDNKLTSVLSSNANPIYAILNEALKEPSVSSGGKFIQGTFTILAIEGVRF